jgi:hypothetical protein
LATKVPSIVPFTLVPTTKTPTFLPTKSPTRVPSNYPSHFPSHIPTDVPSWPYHINGVWPKDWEPDRKTIATYVKAGTKAQVRSPPKKKSQ